MSTLVDHQIRKLCEGLARMVAPYVESQLQPASYDVRLGTSFLAVDKRRLKHVDLGDPSTFEDLYTPRQLAEGEAYALPPKGFVLGCTLERVQIPMNVVGRIEGRSSLARLGLIMESAGYLDPGFQGRITLEIYNLLPVPIILRPGLSIAQLSFSRTDAKPERGYGHPDLGSHYQNDDEATGSRFGT